MKSDSDAIKSSNSFVAEEAAGWGWGAVVSTVWGLGGKELTVLMIGAW